MPPVKNKINYASQESKGHHTSFWNWRRNFEVWGGEIFSPRCLNMEHMLSSRAIRA